MKFIKNLMLVFLSLISIVIILFLIFNQALNASILKPYESINYLNESGVYEDVEIIVEEEIFKNLEIDPNSNDIISVTFSNLVKTIVNDEWIASISNDIQSSLWRYIIGESKEIEPVELIELNNYINSEIEKITYGNDFLKDAINSKLVQYIPDTIDLKEYLGDYTEYLEKAKRDYQIMKIFEIFVYLLLIFIIIFIAMTASNLIKTLTSLSVIFTISGVIALVPVLILNLADMNIIYNYLNSFDIYQYFPNSLYVLFDLIIADVSVNSSLISIMVLLTGLFLLLISKILKMRKSRIKNI